MTVHSTERHRVSGAGRRVLLAGLLPTLVAALLVLVQPSWIGGLERATYDTVVRHAATKSPSDRIVIVDVDERSLSTIGQWPWRREQIGRLVGTLRSLGAAVVGIDIVFAEPDRFEPPSRAAARGSDGRAQPAAPTGSDAAFAKVLAGGGVVLGYAMTFDRRPGSAATRCLLHPIDLPVVHGEAEAPEAPFFSASGVICNLPELAKAAGNSGFLNAAPDIDGILRRVPLFIEYEGRVYPGLALAVVATATHSSDAVLRVANVNSSALALDGATVPLDGQSNMLVRYRGEKNTFRYLSAADVLNGQVPAGSLDGSIVFLGTTALGTREVVATPLDTLFAGVEVQATVADNLLRQDYLWRHEHALLLESATVIALGLLSALLVRSLGLAWSASATVVCVVGLWAGAVKLLETRGLFLSPLFPTLGSVSALVVMTFARVANERRRADQAGREETRSRQLMVQALLSLTETRDAETGQHARRTQGYSRLLAEELAKHPRFEAYLTPERINLVSNLAPLHDIGKVGVPDHILNKAGKLTADELIEMRRHPAYGRDAILRAENQADVHDDETLEIAKEIVYTHHERWDGGGYPQGLVGEAIPIPGRIMALVDVYDAVISKRIYAEPMSFDEAEALIARNRGTHFDPAVADAFIRVAPAMRRLSLEADHRGVGVVSGKGSDKASAA